MNILDKISGQFKLFWILYIYIYIYLFIYLYIGLYYMYIYLIFYIFRYLFVSCFVYIYFRYRNMGTIWIYKSLNLVLVLSILVRSRFKSFGFFFLLRPSSERLSILKFAKLCTWTLKVFFSKSKILNLTSKLFLFYTMIRIFVIINLNL